MAITTSTVCAHVIGVQVYNPEGLDIEALKAHQASSGTLLGFPGAAMQLPMETATSLLEAECDILVPAALEKQITQARVHLPRVDSIATL